MNSSPNPAPLPLQAAPAAAPSVGRRVQANGLDLNCLDYGSAGRPALLCVHGGAANAHWFDFVAGQYAKAFHVLAIDLRGHGDSEWKTPPSYFYRDYASDLDAVVRHLDLRDFALIGHSMGGMVSLVYATSYPGRMKRLVIVDSLLNLPAERIAKLRDVGSKPGSTYASQEELVSRYRLRPGHSVAAPEVVRHIAMNSGRALGDGRWKLKFDRAVYATRESYDGRPLWARVTVPALLVRGDHSERVTPQAYAEAKARCPQLELATVPNAWHHVMLDNPQGFVAATLPFLQHR